LYFMTQPGGSNSVPGQKGFAAVVGYDQVTGLGSIGASLLVRQSDAATVCGTGKVAHGRLWKPSQRCLMVSVSGGFNARVAFSVAGLPGGLSATFPPVTLSAPGSGSSLLKITAPSGVRIGTLLCHGFSYQWKLGAADTIVRHIRERTRHSSLIVTEVLSLLRSGSFYFRRSLEIRVGCKPAERAGKGSKSTILEPRPVPASRKPLRPDESGSPRS